MLLVFPATLRCPAATWLGERVGTEQLEAPTLARNTGAASSSIKSTSSHQAARRRGDDDAMADIVIINSCMADCGLVMTNKTAEALPATSVDVDVEVEGGETVTATRISRPGAATNMAHHTALQLQHEGIVRRGTISLADLNPDLDGDGKVRRTCPRQC